MAKEKFSTNKKIETGLIFQHMDPYMARFTMDNPQGLLSKRTIEINPAEIFPEDFDPGKYKVSGKITITIEVKER